MCWKQKIIPVLASILNVLGVHRFCTKGRGVILTFHDVSDSSSLINCAGTVSVEFLESVLKEVRQSGMKVIRLRDVPDYLSGNHKERFVVLTFDDGYKSMLEYVLPLLEQYEMPATVFVTSEAMEGRLDYVWGVLSYYLKSCNEISIGGFNAQTKTLLQKQTAYRDIMSRSLRDYNFWQSQFRDFCKSKNLDVAALCRKDFLDKNGVKKLASSSFIDIGGHTKTHRMLSKLADSEAYEEIAGNKKQLSELLGATVDCFAYPFGGEEACNAREFSMAAQSGYKIAVTTRCGVINNDVSLFSLPRVHVNGLYETMAMTRLYLSGVWSGLRSVTRAMN